MDEKTKLQKDIEALREMTKAELKDMWIQGYNKGTISTCAILYKTFLMSGWDESNVLFVILKDMAERAGCKDINAAVADLSTAD